MKTLSEIVDALNTHDYASPEVLEVAKSIDPTIELVYVTDGYRIYACHRCNLIKTIYEIGGVTVGCSTTVPS